MNEEIKSGLLQDVRDLDPATLSASAADGKDGGQTGDQKKTGGDSDGTDTYNLKLSQQPFTHSRELLLRFSGSRF